MSIEFSYPTIGGDIANQGFFTYSDPKTNKYVTFTQPSEIYIKDITDSDISRLFIKHENIKGVGDVIKGNVYVIFKLKEDSEAKPLKEGYPYNIKFDSLIKNDLARQDSKFSFTGKVQYLYDDTAYTFSKGNHYFIVLGEIRVKSIEESYTEGKVPTWDSELIDTSILIPFQLGFDPSTPSNPSITSENDLICDESEVDTTPSTQTSTNTALNIGVVMVFAFVLMGCLMLIKQVKPDMIKFNIEHGLLGGFETQKPYLIITGIFFIISFALFISNGVKPNNYILMFALVFLVNTIIMMWFKVAVFTTVAA